MKNLRFTACAVALAALSAVLPAQQAPSGFHTVNCIQIKPEKSGEFHKWVSDVLQKFAKSRVDSGVISTWYLLRAVFPQAEPGQCDYLTIALYPGAPPEPLNPEQFGAALKKAGVSMSAEEYMARRDSIATLVSTSLYQNQQALGAMKKGDYLVASSMKAADAGEWLKFEKEVWKPFADQLIKDGIQSGWSVNVLVMPGGADLHQGVTVDVYPSWDAVWKDDPKFAERFKKVHPDMDLEKSFTQMVKVRTQARINMYFVEDMIGAAK